MTARTTVTVEEARRIIEEAEQTLAPYSPPRTEIADYHSRLLHDNPEASAAEIRDALDRWTAEQTDERRGRAERQSAANERQARQTACRMCGTPGQQLAHVGVTELERRQGARYGFVDFFCVPCRFVIGAEWSAAMSAEIVGDKTRAELARQYLAAKKAI